MTHPDGKHLSFPFRIGPEGRPVQVTTLEEHVRDELIQLLLTNPGERVYLPEFGGGVRKLVFEPADQAAQAMTKSMIAEAISTWLGERIELEELNVDPRQVKLPRPLYDELVTQAEDVEEENEE